MNLLSWFKSGFNPIDTIKEKEERLEQSQQFLINAAVAISDVAGALTNQIRRRYESEMQFETTSNVIEDALIICSLNEPGLIQYANETAQHDFGGELTKIDVGKLFTFGDNREFADTKALFNYLFTSDKPFGVHRNGQTFPVKVNMERLDWLDGTASMMILARRLTKDAEPISLTFDGILVVQEDRIVAANPSIKAIFGYDNVSLLGQPLSSLFPKEKADLIKMVSDNGDRHLIGTHDDGHPLHLRLATVHLTKVFNEITARLVTVKPVKADTERAEKFKMTADNGVDMFVSFKPDGQVTFANSTFSRVYGITRNEIMKMNMADVLSPTEYELLRINMKKITPTHPSLRVQVPHPRENQAPALHDWIWHADFNERGEVIEYHRTGRDISEIVANIVTTGYF